MSVLPLAFQGHLGTIKQPAGHWKKIMLALSASFL
jgi:hypothetical protein